MATIPTQEEIDSLNQVEKDRLEFKRKLTNNPEWNIAGEAEHGAGLLPESIWKELHPNSNPDTAIPDRIEKRLTEGQDNGKV